VDQWQPLLTSVIAPPNNIIDKRNISKWVVYSKITYLSWSNVLISEKLAGFKIDAWFRNIGSFLKNVLISKYSLILENWTILKQILFQSQAP
jgi:hypothetical protein